MSMLIKKLAILFKVESVYGTDSVPTGAANALQVANVKFTPLAGSTAARNLIKPYLGNQGKTLTGIYRQIEFDVEMGGSSAAGTPPPYGALLRACGFAEVTVEDTSVEYSPVSTAFESGSLYYFLDGTKYAMLGCRGKFTVALNAQQKPILHFTMSGFRIPLVDAALPAAVYSTFVEPPVVSKANTQFAFAGITPPMLSVNIDVGQDIQPRLIVNYEAIEHSDRSSTGTIVIDQNLKAVKDWEALAIAETAVDMLITHGTVAGNTIAIEGAGATIGQLTHGDAQGVANYSLPIDFKPVSGNDELVLTFT